MKKNIGLTDRLIRLFIAVIAFILAWLLWGSWMSFLFIAIGLFTLYEAAAAWCALYQIVGKSTCSLPKDKDF